ncbi:MAG: M13-type metalloendopeptidase [Oscillospiraceae bacterium]|jgi:putative endopeptidase
MRKLKQSISVLLAVLLLVGTLPAARAQETYATRGQVADMLIAAADDYNPGLQRSDVIRGYEDGDLDENGAVTRAQALVMLSRAFGRLPTPVGDNARSGYSAANFTDIPDWAKSELANVFDAGIVAGTSATTFSPDANVTIEQMELFISRVFALEGSNLRDDFYATVNKSALDASIIQPGRAGAGSYNDLSAAVSQELAATVKDISLNPRTDGEKKIATLYANILNKTERNKVGITPIKKYLDAIRSAESMKALAEAHNMIYQDSGTALLFGFGITPDAKNSNVYDLVFASVSASLGQSGYANATSAQKTAYTNYIAKILTLVGESAEDAAKQAQAIWDFEAAIAAASLPTQDLGDVDKTYNLFTMAQLQRMFPNVDLNAVFTLTGYQQTNKIVVTDVGALKAAAAFCDDAHVDLLKSYCLFELGASSGTLLNDDFLKASQEFQSTYIGVSGTLSDEETASQYIQSLMSDDLSRAYVSRYFSPQAKAYVENMVGDIISTYRGRIKALDWMSETTKAQAIRKLDTMKIRIGYPDEWKDYYKDVEIKSVANGGSFYDNVLALNRRAHEISVEKQISGVDKSEWPMLAYTVNACYDPTDNSITFPAAFLQKPYFDINASYEKNLGGIGYVIGHEITHAFDNNGAKYDESGNATDWWTQSDYEAFQRLCGKVVTLYDGREVAPGITCNGALTLSENIADLGSAACITEIESKRTNPDYKALYTAMSEAWCSSYPRAYRELLARLDVHAPDKLRGSLVMQQFQQFYDAFGIKPGDGMWIAPENRVTIW